MQGARYEVSDDMKMTAIKRLEESLLVSLKWGIQIQDIQLPFALQHADSLNLYLTVPGKLQAGTPGYACCSLH